MTSISQIKKIKITNKPSLPNLRQDSPDELQSNQSLKNRGSLLLRTSRYLNNKMDLGFYFAILKSMEIDIFLTSWITITSLRLLTIWSILSNFVLLFFVINNIVYSILTLRIFYRHIWPKKMNKINRKYINIEAKNEDKKRENEDIENKKDESFEEASPSLALYFKKIMRPGSKYGILTFIAFSLRDIFLPLFLVYFVTKPWI